MTTTASPVRRRGRARRASAALAGALVLTAAAAACGDDGDDEDLILGAPPDCEENPFCIPGLREVYGVDLSGGFVPIDAPEVIPESLRSGAIDVGVMFSTDAALADPELVALEDDEGMFAAENVLPVGTEELAEAYGDDLAEVLDGISSELTTEGLIEMNSRYDVDHDDADAIAADWLAEHGPDQGDDAERDGPTIRVGSQNFGESIILAEIYRQALEANGFDVTTQEVGGFRELLFDAFGSGDVNLAPEYLGSELNFLSEGEATEDVEESLEKLRDLLAEREMVTWEPAEAANSNVFVMTRETSEDLDITRLSDLG